LDLSLPAASFSGLFNWILYNSPSREYVGFLHNFSLLVDPGGRISGFYFWFWPWQLS
jgi:hypothetical protein